MKKALPTLLLLCAVTFCHETGQLVAVDDLSFLGVKHKGSDVIIFDTSGVVRTRFGRSGGYTGHPTWYHDVAVDRDGNIYAADILGNSVQLFRKTR